MLAFCLAEVRGSQKWGEAGVVKNLEPGVIPAERKSYLFSPVRDKIWWLFRENTLQQRKRHSTLKSDASFCLSRKVFPDEISPRLHLLEALRVGQNRYIRQMFESNATRHYNPQCLKACGFVRWALIFVLE